MSYYINKTTTDGKTIKLKDYKKRARRNRMRRKFLLFMLILSIVILVLTYAPFMRVKHINCYGNEKIETKTLVSTSALCIGNNIIRADKKGAVERIKALPYVKDVTIRRKLPSTINITITESRVAAYINNNDKYIFLDDIGKVLEISNIPPSTQCPILVGTTIQSAEVNETIAFKDPEQINAFVELFKVINTSKFIDKLTVLSLEKTDDIRFVINNAIEVILGDTENLDYKINFLASGAYDSIGDNRPGTMNVSYGKSVIYKEKN